MISLWHIGYWIKVKVSILFLYLNLEAKLTEMIMWDEGFKIDAYFSNRGNFPIITVSS